MSTQVALVDADVATMVPGGSPYGLIHDGAVLIEEDTIAWVGKRADLDVTGDVVMRSVGGRLLTPGLVDCHTHLVFGGNRASEFEQRLSGATYEEIASAGGGIRSTVGATRAAGADELLRSGRRRLDRLHHSGATTVEVKSGYGLDTESELTMLEVTRMLGDLHAVDVVTTLLAAHAVPEEYFDDPEGYLDSVIDDLLPHAVEAGLVDAVDAFCETIAFTPEQVDRLFAAARRLKVPVKIHAAQLAESRAVDVAIAHDALSADHLEHATEEQVAAMAGAGTVAVLLPGATHMLRTARPPVEALRGHGVPIALASDLNPGTSPVGDLALVCNLAAVLLGLTPEEALAGVTRHGAAALGLGHDRGMLTPGRRADLAAWDVDHPAEISYWAGMDLCSAVWVSGRPSFDRTD